MAEKANNHSTAKRAVSVLAMEIEKRGGVCLPESKLQRRSILEIKTPDDRTLQLRIKSKTKGDWQTNADEGDRVPQIDNDKFWVFIDLGKNQGNEKYYIVPEYRVKEDIYKRHQEYKGRNDGKRPVNDNSNHHSIKLDRIKLWEFRWDLLGLTSNAKETSVAHQLSLAASTPNATSGRVLLKEVGKSQHKDGVRIDKAFHDIFNPPNSPFYTERGTARPITVTFNGNEFDAEYRYEGTKAKEVDLQRIGFFSGLRGEFKKVFPVPRGTFTIRVGSDLNHFIFDHEQVTSESYNEKLENEVGKSRKDSKEARLKRLAEADRKPASVQVTSVAYIRNSDVIVEVLERAKGKCEACLQDAPFLRAKDKTPYLEVHHKTPLSEGGEDVIENAIAVCPNCHRKMHYGMS